MIASKPMKIFIFNIIFLFILISKVTSKDIIKIGIPTFLSGGAASSFGIPIKQSFQLMFEAIKKGELPEPYNSVGIAGAQVEFFFIDEAGGATKQVAEFRNMVERQNVDIVLGYVSSGDCLAIPSVAEELKTITVLVDCGTPRVFEDASYKYVFRTGPHAAMDNIAGVRYLINRGYKLDKIAGINQNYAWGQDSWADFKNSIKVLSPKSKFVSEQFPKIFSGQYGTEISALTVSRANVIHSSLWGADLESFIIQASARGLLRNRKIYLSAGDHILPSIKNNIPDGVIISARGPHGDFAPDNKLSKWFKNKLIEKYDIKMATQPLSKAAMAALFIKSYYDKAFKDIGSFPNDEDVIKAMTNLNWETPSGNVSMSLGNGHQAVQHTAVGETKWDPKEKRVKLVNIEYYSASCVNPPEGIKAIKWINEGFSGANCEKYEYK